MLEAESRLFRLGRRLGPARSACSSSGSHGDSRDDASYGCYRASPAGTSGSLPIFAAAGYFTIGFEMRRYFAALIRELRRAE